MNERTERFSKDDPLHDLHVPRRKRLAEDVGRTANALVGGKDDEFDRDEVRNRGEVVDEKELQ